MRRKTQKKRILIADDDKSILEALQLILEDEGYVVETVTDGSTIFNLHGNYPDLLLLDIWMYGKDGGEICSYLKSQKKTKNIPIIIVSANKDTAIIAKEAGADDFLSKPFEIVELLDKVKKYIN